MQELRFGLVEAGDWRRMGEGGVLVLGSGGGGEGEQAELRA